MNATPKCGMLPTVVAGKLQVRPSYPTSFPGSKQTGEEPENQATSKRGKGGYQGMA